MAEPKSAEATLDDLKRASCALPDSVWEQVKAGHFGLRFDRFAGRQQVKGAPEYAALGKSWDTHRGALEDCLKAAMERNEEAAKQAGANAEPPVAAERLDIEFDSRLLIGAGLPAGRSGVGMALHPLLGCPYLPAAALKGVARRQALAEIAWDPKHEVPYFDLERHKNSFVLPTYHENADRIETTTTWTLLAALLDLQAMENAAETEPRAQKEWRQLADGWAALGLPGELPSARSLWGAGHERRRILGTVNGGGKAAFFDGLPLKDVRLAPAIWNPHYAPYYTNNEAPADWHQPNPICLLTVKKGAWFRCCVGGEGADRASRWLEAGLKEFGIGSRTRKGYGRVKTVARSSL